MVPITGLTFNELEQFVENEGFKKFRAKQIARWIYKKLSTSFEEMTDLSKEAKEKLSKRAKIRTIHLLRKERSEDGTVKYLFELKDGNRIESVFIPERDWNTICISTQVGCPIGCRFCLTAKDGFTRNLKASEIVEQYLEVQRDVKDRRISNVVFMGMGEPLLNFKNVKKSIEIMVDERMLNLSSRKITVSTCGIIPGIERMAKELRKVKLAISLHATDNLTRNALVPINRKYPLEQLIKTLRKYPADNVRRIMIEYVMLKNVNDSKENAEKLAALVKGIPVKVNLIPFNPYPDAEFEKPSREKVEEFQRVLWNKNIAAFIRDSRGEDISAACGMLRTKVKQA